MRRARWKKKALGVLIPPLAGLDKYGGPNKRLRCKILAEALGAGSVLPNVSVHSPRPGIAQQGCNTDLVCVSFRCRSPYLPAARSEAERSGPGAEAIRRPPRKPLRTNKCGVAPSLFPKAQAHLAGDCPITGASARSTPVPRSNRHRCVDLSRPGIFSFDRERPFSFRCIEKKMGGSFPAPQSGALPRPRPVAGHSPIQRRTLWKSSK